MKKGVVNALTVKKESQQKPSVSHTSVRMKRQHGITSSDVNNLSRLSTSVSSKALIVLVFYCQVVKSRTTFKEEVILLLKYSQFLLKTRINQGNRDVKFNLCMKGCLRSQLLVKKKKSSQRNENFWKLYPSSAIWSFFKFFLNFSFFSPLK